MWRESTMWAGVMMSRGSNTFMSSCLQTEELLPSLRLYPDRGEAGEELNKPRENPQEPRKSNKN